MPQQFKNPANPGVHRKTTAKEILDVCGEKLDALVVGVGTGGTATGAGEIVKQKIESLKLFAVEPAESPVFSGGKAGPHKIQGIGAGFIPEVFNRRVVDRFIPVSYDDARKRRAPSCGARGDSLRNLLGSDSSRQLPGRLGVRFGQTRARHPTGYRRALSQHGAVVLKCELAARCAFLLLHGVWTKSFPRTCRGRLRRSSSRLSEDPSRLRPRPVGQAARSRHRHLPRKRTWRSIRRIDRRRDPNSSIRRRERRKVRRHRLPHCAKPIPGAQVIASFHDFAANAAGSRIVDGSGLRESGANGEARDDGELVERQPAAAGPVVSAVAEARHCRWHGRHRPNHTRDRPGARQFLTYAGLDAERFGAWTSHAREK